jgi:predicted nucleotidyltransferase component of viral defense system
MYALQGIGSRPTTDIDFSGIQVSNELDEMKAVFQNILSQETVDPVIFNLKTLDASRIKEQDKYEGIRIKCEAAFDSIRQYIQIDIGFGDLITPEPIAMEYPILLSDFPTPMILAYTIETVIAEKLHTMLVLGQINSRMKDYFDVYNLLQDYRLDKGILKTAIEQTFQNRNTALELDVFIFTEAYYQDSAHIKMWRAFLKKINADALDFEEVMQTIKALVYTLFEKR